MPTQEDGIKYCCRDFVKAIQNKVFESVPNTRIVYVPGDLANFQFCPFCGTKIAPWKYYSPADNPFNKR